MITLARSLALVAWVLTGGTGIAIAGYINDNQNVSTVTPSARAFPGADGRIGDATGGQSYLAQRQPGPNRLEGGGYTAPSVPCNTCSSVGSDAVRPCGAIPLSEKDRKSACVNSAIDKEAQCWRQCNR
jgi:hypothetical protein